MVYGKITKGLPPLRRPKLSKKAQDKEDEIKNYMKLIGIVMIGDFNYIGKRLEWVNPRSQIKWKILFSFFNFKV